MSRTQHTVRRCAPCDENWPATSAYNLCPRCQRNTYASTDEDLPSTFERAKDAARYAKYRDFDERCDAGTLLRVPQEWADEMNALLAQTPDIPDPAPTNYGLLGKGRANRHDSAKYPTPRQMTDPNAWTEDSDNA